MQGDVFNEVVVFGPFDDIKIRDFKCEDIYGGSFQNKFILLLDARLESVEECQKLTCGSFGVLFLLLGVLLALLCFGLLALQ